MLAPSPVYLSPLGAAHREAVAAAVAVGVEAWRAGWAEAEAEVEAAVDVVAKAGRGCIEVASSRAGIAAALGVAVGVDRARVGEALCAQKCRP